MNNLKIFFTTIMLVVSCINHACEEAPLSVEENMPEVIIVADRGDLQMMLLGLMYDCFHNNNVEACQFSIATMMGIAGARIEDLQEKNAEQEKVIDTFTKKQQKKADRKALKKKEKEEIAEKKAALGNKTCWWLE